MRYFIPLLFSVAVSVLAASPEKSLWPAQVTLKSDLVFEKKLPNGFLKMTAKAGQKVQLISAENMELTVRYNDTTGKAGIPDTDFLEQCQAAQDKIDASESARLVAQAAESNQRAEEEAKRMAEEKAFEEFEKNPPKFNFDPITHQLTSPKNLQKLVELVFRDPDSFKLRECLSAKVIKHKGELCWETIWVYGARNGFGGYNKAMIKLFVKDDKVIDFDLLDKK